MLTLAQKCAKLQHACHKQPHLSDWTYIQQSLIGFRWLGWFSKKAHATMQAMHISI